MIIRPEIPRDIEAIRHVTAVAFADRPFSNQTEPAIIEALRADNMLSLSLVADMDGDIVGQITFSPVSIDGTHSGWFGLGPVSVDPARQRTGVGSALIKAGLHRITEDGAQGCVLVGDPAYYARFGFEGDTDLQYGDLDRRYVQRLALNGSVRGGILTYCEAFEKAASG